MKMNRRQLICAPALAVLSPGEERWRKFSFFIRKAPWETNFGFVTDDGRTFGLKLVYGDDVSAKQMSESENRCRLGVSLTAAYVSVFGKVPHGRKVSNADAIRVASAKRAIFGAAWERTP